MSKVTLEWADGEVHKQVKLDIHWSRRGNNFVKHGENVYVFRKLKMGEDVVTQQDGKWVKVGRITRSCKIFLGEGQSYDEKLKEQAEERRKRGEPLWAGVSW